MLRYQDLFVLEFQTDSGIPGSFNIAACAYATGVPVNVPEADVFLVECGEDLAEAIDNVVMETNAFSIEPLPTVVTRSSSDSEFDSFCIFFSEEPADNLRRLIEDRVIDYLTSIGVNLLHILGYRMSGNTELVLVTDVEN